jgi:hypothetical protein
MLDSRMPQIEGGSFNVVVVWICMVLDLGAWVDWESYICMGRDSC